MDTRCTIFTAELVTIQAALFYAKNLEEQQGAVIVVDSLAAINTIVNNDISVYKNLYAIKAREYIESIKKQRNGNRKIVLVWAPSHIGIEGNEIADTLAKKCTNEESNKEVIVPRGDLKKLV